MVLLMAAILTRCSSIAAANSAGVPLRASEPAVAIRLRNAGFGGDRLHIGRDAVLDFRRYAAPPADADSTLEGQVVGVMSMQRSDITLYRRNEQSFCAASVLSRQIGRAHV